jgi:hypothetical protein
MKYFKFNRIFILKYDLMAADNIEKLAPQPSVVMSDIFHPVDCCDD